MKIEDYDLDQNQVKAYFEWIGRITVEFSVVETMGLEFLAALVNKNNSDVGYFVAFEYDKKTFQKFDLIARLIKLPYYKKRFGEDMVKAVGVVLKDFEKARKLRNDLIHKLLVFTKDSSNNVEAIPIKFSKVTKQLVSEDKFTIEMLGGLFMDIVKIQVDFTDIFNMLNKVLEQPKAKPTS